VEGNVELPFRPATGLLSVVSSRCGILIPAGVGIIEGLEGGNLVRESNDVDNQVIIYV
jgi:hypothetical protein